MNNQIILKSLYDTTKPSHPDLSSDRVGQHEADERDSGENSTVFKNLARDVQYLRKNALKQNSKIDKLTSTHLATRRRRRRNDLLEDSTLSSDESGVHDNDVAEVNFYTWYEKQNSLAARQKYCLSTAKKHDLLKFLSIPVWSGDR